MSSANSLRKSCQDS